MERTKLTKGRKLFVWDDSDRLINTYIHPYKTMQWDLYAIGYKYAGDIIIDNAYKDSYYMSSEYGWIGFYKSDVLIWPVVFLYRQYLELRLKSINIRANMLKKLEDESEIASDNDMDFNPTHDLMTSWKRCRDFLEKKIDDKTELDAMHEFIEEYSDIDAKSFIFRYPVDKKETPWEFKKCHRQFSLEILRDVMNDIFNFLEEQNTNLEYEIEYQEECLRDMPQEFY